MYDSINTYVHYQSKATGKSSKKQSKKERALKMAEKLLADEENGEAADDGGGSDSDEPAKVCCVCFPVLFLVVDSFAYLLLFYF